MTVWATRRYGLYCNGIKADGSPCLRNYSPPPGLDHWPKPAELRRLAAGEGWTRVRNPIGRRYDQDFCPLHRPAQEDADV